MDNAMVERVARAIAGHFGPDFDQLPKDRAEARSLVRQGADFNGNDKTSVMDAARAALQSLGYAEMGWQLIETAPRDGTDVLVCVTYNLPDDEWQTATWVDNWFADGWTRWADRIDIPFTPTHWMPLPEPPRTALRGDRESGEG